MFSVTKNIDQARFNITILTLSSDKNDCRRIYSWKKTFESLKQGWSWIKNK